MLNRFCIRNYNFQILLLHYRDYFHGYLKISYSVQAFVLFYVIQTLKSTKLLLFGNHDNHAFIPQVLFARLKTCNQTTVADLYLELAKGGFPVMAEITRILAANICRQFFFFIITTVLAAWLLISTNLLFAASKCHFTIRRQW